MKAERIALAISMITSGFLFIGNFAPAFADYLFMTPAGLKNLGSGAAYSFNCEKDGFSPVGGSRKILRTASEVLSPENAQILRRQFQTSIHEKKIFSPLRNQWFKFVVDEKNCIEVTKTIPLLLDALEPQ